MPEGGDGASSCSYESAKETVQSVSPPYQDAMEAEELFSDMVLNESTSPVARAAQTSVRD